MRTARKKLALAAATAAMTLATAIAPATAATTGRHADGAYHPNFAAMMKNALEMVPNHWEGPTRPVKVPKGVKIAAITCYSILEGCVIPADGIATAARDIGWQERTFDGGGTPTTQSAQILNAVSWGAKVIALIAITPSAVEAALQAAKKAGAIIVSGSSGLNSPNPTVQPPKGDLWSAVDVSPNYPLLGKHLAEWVIANSKGKADIAVYGDKEFDSINAQQAGFVPEIHTCKTCTISPVMYFTATQISSALGPEVVGYLRSHPSTGYIYAGYDPPAAAMVSAIQNAGLAHQVQIVSALGNSQNLHFIRQGQVETADAAYDNTYMGFAMVDQSIRLLDHVPVVQPEGEGLPFQVLDRGNLPKSLASWRAPFNYEQKFLQLWKR